jgi:hypothetical protein
MIQKVNGAGAERLILAGVKSGVTVLLEGPPGCGKTSLARAVARTVDLPLVELIGSTLGDSSEVAGVYAVIDGKLTRHLIPEIERACNEPVILFLDELTTTLASVRGPMMRLILERVAGNRSLHPGTRIIAACNPSTMAPSATDLDAATGNRLIRGYFAPDVRDVAAWFAAVADPAWSANAADFAATVAVDPSLVTVDPPDAAIETGAPFASPRGWELALRAWSADGSQLDDPGYAILAGAVGESAATAYLSIRKLRAHLPSVETIVANPAGALVPDRADYQIAAVGMIAAVAREDLGAAWIYSERLKPEIGAALAQILIQIKGKAGKHGAAGSKAQITLMAKLHKATH